MFNRRTNNGRETISYKIDFASVNAGFAASHGDFVHVSHYFGTVNMDFALAYIHFVDRCIDFVDVRDDYAMAAIDFGMVIPDFAATHVNFLHV